MTETLTIRNFGPIKDVTLDLRKVNVFIGDQGTGKSTVAKLYAALNSFYLVDVLFKEELESINDKDTFRFFKSLELFDIHRFINVDSEIKTNIKAFNFIFRNGKMDVSLIKENVKDIIEKLKIGQASAIFSNYIPAERVFVSTLADAFYGLNQFGIKLPTLFNQFGTLFSNARKEKQKSIYQEILNADFAHLNGIDSIIMKNGQTLMLSDASTGLQGTIPMLVVFDSIIGKIQKTGGSRSQSQMNNDYLLVIEEPELNLFPETQKKLLEYIIGNNFEVPTKVETSKYDDEDVEVSEDFENKVFKNQLIITTHSPYTLTTLNNLMYAYQVGQKHKAEVSKIIPKKYWVNPEDVRCYLMEDGEAKPIMDNRGLIKASFIDSVSKDLNKEYNEIFNIELGISNETVI